MGLRPAPTVYAWDEPPPGVDKMFLDPALVASRPIITPRGLLNHTNGASVPVTIDSAYRWANQWNDNTKQHFQAQRDGSAAMFLPLNRKGIANYKAAWFFTAIETQDLGWPNPGPVAYTLEQADTIAAIVAYQHILCDMHGIHMPLAPPQAWDGSGVGSHTDPFGYPYWTNSRGKVCPGWRKKEQLYTLIIPLAQEYVSYWTTGGPPMKSLDDKIRWLHGSHTAKANEPWSPRIPAELRGKGITEIAFNLTIPYNHGFTNGWIDVMRYGKAAHPGENSVGNLRYGQDVNVYVRVPVKKDSKGEERVSFLSNQPTVGPIYADVVAAG